MKVLYYEEQYVIENYAKDLMKYLIYMNKIKHMWMFSVFILHKPKGIIAKNMFIKPVFGEYRKTTASFVVDRCFD